jgi:antitoxin HicB
MQARAKHPETELASYLSAPFVRMLIPNTEGEGYVAEVLELPGCLSEGETPEEAYRNLDEAMSGYIASLLDHNRPVPEPVGTKEYSGHFPLRMSTEVHRIVALRAMQEGISLNQWIVNAITAHLAGQSLGDEVVAKLRAGMAFRFFAGMALESPEVPVGGRPMELDSTKSGRYFVIEGGKIRPIEESGSSLSWANIVTPRREPINA